MELIIKKNNDLINEFKSYKFKPYSNKARRIYFLCLNNSKIELAKKISQKYNIRDCNHVTDAFNYALLNMTK